MDPETEVLIHQLQLEDARESLVQYAWSGGGFGDTTVAFDAYRQDAERALREKTDREEAERLNGQTQQEQLDRFAAFKLLSDEQANRIGVSEAVKEENREITDHELARRLGEIEAAEADGDEGVDETFEHEEVVKMSSGMREFKKYSELTTRALDWTHPEVDKPLTKRAPIWAKEDKHAVCCSCLEAKPKRQTLITLCDQTYCRHCLLDLFKASMTDIELFPPRCCRHNISLEQASVFFTAEFTQEFEEKSVELSTPDPTYCSDPQCAKFVRVEAIQDDVAKCPFCFTKTCTTCKGEDHYGVCPEDPEKQKLLEMAEEEGWQRCFRCKTLVELGVGCNHMTYVVLYLGLKAFLC